MIGGLVVPTVRGVERDATARELSRLSDFISGERDRILLEWERLVRAQHAGDDVPSPLLRDHVPGLLERIAAVVDRGDVGGTPLGDSPDQHALARLDLGFDLGSLVAEYKLLRATVLRLRAADTGGIGRIDDIARFDIAIDDAIGRAVAYYAAIRGRTLAAFDQLSQAALRYDDPVALLPRLLEVVVNAVEAVDMGAFFLWESGALHVGASVGMREDFADLTLLVGEGFAGTVAARREPVLSSGADPVVSPRALPPDTKALYGVPLLDGDDLVGVAYMGSKTAWEFAPEDTLLLREMATRATAFLVQARLRRAERAEHARAQESEARLREAAVFRETFLGVVSHDLRNLLGAITSAASVLLGRTLDERSEEMVSLISRTAFRMSRMIRDLLDFTRGRLGGGIPVTRQPCDAAVVCAQVVDEQRAAHPERQFQFAPEGDLRGEWDPDRLAQAVMNLCENAHDYGTPGAPVRVSASDEGDSVAVAVENEGEPIPADHLRDIFEPYRRMSARRAEAGMGLGLFIVREVALAHGGEVAAHQAGRTVVFTLRLPRRAPAPRAG